MIDSRDTLLMAIRKADPSPSGLTIHAVSFVGGKALRFGRVTTDEMKRTLITRIKLAPSVVFRPGVTWEIPHVREKRTSKDRAPQRRSKPRS